MIEHIVLTIPCEHCGGQRIGVSASYRDPKYAPARTGCVTCETCDTPDAPDAEQVIEAE